MKHPRSSSIFVHDYAGHPFQVQLSRALARRGHRVRHAYCGSNLTPHGSLVRRAGDPEQFAVTSIDIGEMIDKYRFVRRRAQERRYGRFLARCVRENPPDVVISANTPLESQTPLIEACRRNGVRFVNWIQDAYGRAVHELLRHRWGGLGAAIGHFYVRLERNHLRRSSAVVVISDDFVPYVLAAGVAPERIHVIPNWAPIEEFPMRPRDNPWSRSQRIVDKFVLLYSGTLGLKHNPGMLRAIARSFKDDRDVELVVISEGPGADWLAESARRDRLDNVRVLGFQPYEQLPDVLASGDVLLVLLESGAGTFSVPSKVLSYMCAGRPILGAMPEENLAARLIREHDAGYVVAPDDSREFAALAGRLRSPAAHREELGRRAREYAERAFSIEAITDRFESILVCR